MIVQVIYREVRIVLSTTLRRYIEIIENRRTRLALRPPERWRMTTWCLWWSMFCGTRVVVVYP